MKIISEVFVVDFDVLLVGAMKYDLNLIFIRGVDLVKSYEIHWLQNTINLLRFFTIIYTIV